MHIKSYENIICMGVLILRQVNKKIGIGSISLLLYVMGILFVSSFGDNVLKFIGLNSWSNGSSGTHYTAFYSLLFFIPSVIVGYKFKNNLGATLGKILSLIMIILILIVVPLLAAA
mgnify:CR=1 FL=1